MPDLSAYFKLFLELLLSPNGMLTAGAAVAAAWLARLYFKKKRIPGLVVETIPEDTWFVHRDDNRRLSIVIALRLVNKSGREARIRSVRFSGYSAAQEAPPILLEGAQTSAPLPYPKGEQYRAGMEFRIPPYSTQTAWALYVSKSVDLRNRMSAPLTIRSTDGKRTALRVELRRHPWQIALYSAA